MIPGNNVSKGKNVDAIILAGMQTIKYLLDSENKALRPIDSNELWNTTYYLQRDTDN